MVNRSSIKRKKKLQIQKKKINKKGEIIFKVIDSTNREREIERRKKKRRRKRERNCSYLENKTRTNIEGLVQRTKKQKLRNRERA